MILSAGGQHRSSSDPFVLLKRNLRMQAVRQLIGRGPGRCRPEDDIARRAYSQPGMPCPKPARRADQDNYRGRGSSSANYARTHGRGFILGESITVAMFFIWISDECPPPQESTSRSFGPAGAEALMDASLHPARLASGTM